MEFKCKLLITAIILVVMHLQMAHSQGKKYCGGQIGRALSTICKGNYNTLKKFEPLPQRIKWENTMLGDMPMVSVEELGFPFQSKAEATSLLGGKRRKKRWGVYNECCEKSCTQEELSSYCAQDKKRR